MLKMQDRLYGIIELPELTSKLATTCPLILRLREIRMANIPFFSHPSFANVDRYEHSIGVAHLAWRWAQKNGLSKDLGTALTIAALYHDGATPAYGHLFEEFLSRFGFDHEETLVNVLLGRTEDLPGRENAQIFLGQNCKLRSLLPRPTDPLSPLTAFAIADIAAGKGSLGKLIKGEIDLDNIDNVIRSSSAMGIIEPKEMVHPYEVIDAFSIENDSLRLNSKYAYAISAWSNIRRRLYDSILNNSYEFRAQTAIKWAINECAMTDKALSEQNAWKITDPVLTFNYLRNNPFSRMLVDRVRLGKPPELLFSAWIDDLSLFLGKAGVETIRILCDEISTLANMEVYVNYYIDKRERNIQFDLSDNRSLFEDEEMEKISYQKYKLHNRHPSGIIGAIGVSRIERINHKLEIVDNDVLLSKKTFKADNLIQILEQILKQKPTSFSLGWIGTRGRLGKNINSNFLNFQS